MVTIVLIISRDYLKRIFDNLEFIDCDLVNTKLFVYVDGDRSLYYKVLFNVAASKFINKQVVYRDKGIGSTTDIMSRRKRIADIHNEIKNYVADDFIFLFEDDTLIPKNTIKKFLNFYTIYPNAGFITGLEVGRWGLKHLGVWTVDDLYEIREIYSQEILKGIKEVDASGFYCMMTRGSIYKKHEFKPYSDMMGPDFNFGIDLRIEGYKNYCDYDTHCIHITRNGDLHVKESYPIIISKVNNLINFKIK